MSILEKAQDIFKGIDKPAGLDKAKAARDKLREGIKSDNFESVFGKISKGLDKDMDELEIKEESKRLAIREELKLAVQKEMVDPGALDEFLMEPGNLKAEIESKQGFLEKIKEASLGGGLATLLLAWSESSVDDKGKPTMFGSLLKTVAGWLSGEKADDKKESTSEDLVKTLADKFKTPLALDRKTAVADIEWLKTVGVKTENIAGLVDEATGATGKLPKLMAALSGFTSLGQTSIPTQLKYIYFQKFEDPKIDQLIGILKPGDTVGKYELKTKDMAGANQLLDAALGATDLSIALAKFEKKPETTAPAPTTK